MSRPLRIQYPGSLWHITSRGNEKRDTFYDDRDRLRFVEFLGEAVRRFQWTLTAYVLMSNHYHLLVELTEETLSSGMKWLNSQYASWFNAVHGRVGHLFHGRFKAALIEKETYFLEVARYVVLNPVRAKMVARPEDYAWSSYRATVGACATPDWLKPDDVLRHFGNDRGAACAGYDAFVKSKIASAGCPWDELRGQMFLGGEEWVARMREKIEMKPRAVEHPAAQRNIGRPDMAAIVTAVANVTRVPEERIRNSHGGLLRSVAAWIGCYEGLHTNAEIAASLRLRSDSRAARLVKDCERELRDSEALRDCVDRCVATLSRKNSEQQMRPQSPKHAVMA